MIPLAEPNLTGKESEYVTEAIASGWVGPEGPFVERFEEMVAKAAGRKWAVATITGSAALHAAAKALGFGPGVDVDVEAFAYPAALNVLCALRCNVHVNNNGEYGHDQAWYLSNMSVVRAFVDAAPAIGNPPTDAVVECYSFAANKTVTCGQGGAICGDDPKLESRMRTLIDNRWGLTNYRMANLNAAVGCAQMERLQEFRTAKEYIWKRYERFGLPMIDRGPSRWMSTMNRHHFLGHIKDNPVFEFRVENDWGISLPCSTHLTQKDQDKVIKLCVESLH